MKPITTSQLFLTALDLFKTAFVAFAVILIQYYRGKAIGIEKRLLVVDNELETKMGVIKIKADQDSVPHETFIDLYISKHKPKDPGGG